jgi:PhzF family phenazine biosynthesis protein
MRLPLFQVDAFTSELFGGNPAAVVPLQEWLPEKLMQKIALENNLSETAFFVPEKEGFHIRWFTPVAEVALCGHATLATAHVLFHHLGYKEALISLNSKSGILLVQRKDNLIILNFPSDVPIEVKNDPEIDAALGKSPLSTFKGKTDYLLVFPHESDVTEMNPDFGLLAKTKARGIIVTAKGSSSDFVSRFFGPQVGINEDPVTGSAHTMLTPYWSKILGKTELTALQCSARKGQLHCTLLGDRVLIAGNAVSYLEGHIHLP